MTVSIESYFFVSADEIIIMIEKLKYLKLTI